MSNLREQVKYIVETLENGIIIKGDEVNDYEGQYSEGDILSGYDYLTDSLDIEYICASRNDYLGARVLVAFGGPNIWINTRTQEVEGYWWGESFTMSYNDDAMGIDEALEELFFSC